MPLSTFVPIHNTPRNYAWGIPGGISRAFGGGQHIQPEAELWFGAHPLSPSRMVGERWADLNEWERDTGSRIPYLMKILAAAEALSLQAHPDSTAAAAGYAEEEARGIPRDAPHRNFKDPYAKPELIVATHDGFEALCGFRPIEESIADYLALRELAADPSSFAPLLNLLAGEAGTGADERIRAAFRWVMLDGAEAVVALLDAVVHASEGDPERFELVRRLDAAHAGDPGTLIALLMNHATLRAGECLWLPAGNIHAYLRGIGVELMGPSDNVLRGGLTRKHVDVPELLRVLDFHSGPPPLLAPVFCAPNVAVYRPATVPSGVDVPFELRLIHGPVRMAVDNGSIAMAFDGDFLLRAGTAAASVARGETVFVPRAVEVEVSGRGRLYVACPIVPA